MVLNDKQRERAVDLVIAVASLILIAAFSYIMAVAGEPQAHWLVCNLMHAC